MWKSCSDCCLLNIDNAKCDGVYMCSKTKKYTNASNSACELFEKSYCRKSYERQRLHELGEDANNKADSRSVGSYMVIFILLLIILIITKLLGY